MRLFCGAAVALLVAEWEDERTRRAVEHVAWNVGLEGAEEAVDLLAFHWPDDRTRDGLEMLTLSNDIGAKRAVAALMTGWKDERTRATARERR
jgi:HEAT repeat protein